MRNRIIYIVYIVVYALFSCVIWKCLRHYNGYNGIVYLVERGGTVGLLGWFSMLIVLILAFVVLKYKFIEANYYSIICCQFAFFVACTLCLPYAEHAKTLNPACQYVMWGCSLAHLLFDFAVILLFEIYVLITCILLYVLFLKKVLVPNLTSSILIFFALLDSMMIMVSYLSFFYRR